MPPLNPRADFRDDGGTPGWRANQAAWGRAQPAGFRARWRRLSFGQQVMLIVFVGFVLPCLILWGGLFGLAIFNIAVNLWRP